MEEENKMTSMEALLFFYRHHALTEYLTTLSMNELAEIISRIQTNDIKGDIIGIYDAVLQEVEYRGDNEVYQERSASNKSK